MPVRSVLRCFGRRYRAGSGVHQTPGSDPSFENLIIYRTAIKVKKPYLILNTLVCLLFICLMTAFWGTVSLISVIYSPGGNVAFLCMKWWFRCVL